MPSCKRDHTHRQALGDTAVVGEAGTKQRLRSPMGHLLRYVPVVETRARGHVIWSACQSAIYKHSEERRSVVLIVRGNKNSYYSLPRELTEDELGPNSWLTSAETIPLGAHRRPCGLAEGNARRSKHLAHTAARSCCCVPGMIELKKPEGTAQKWRLVQFYVHTAVEM